MPISVEEGKKEIKEWFNNQNDIKTIVDIGPGSGTYAKLLGGKYKWKAVEIWGPYIKRFKLKKLYSEIRIGDMQYMELPKADCAIVGSVLEHLPRRAAIKTFNKIDRQYKHVVIVMPINSRSNLVFEGNIFEKHISVWTQEQLDEMIPDNYLRIPGFKEFGKISRPAIYMK